jgi:hypothetical protein
MVMGRFISRSGREILTRGSDFRRRNDLPYGKWTCPDGREVLFNRFYEPIWQRHPEQPPLTADPLERVPWEGQEWFYDDATPARQKILRGEAVLAEWNIPLPPRSPRAQRDLLRFRPNQTVTALAKVPNRP